MEYKTYLFLFMLPLLSSVLDAQDFEVPQNYSFKTAADYTKYEKDIIACINWLEKTPLNIEQKKRKDANSFLLQWITGSSISITINSDIVVKYTDKNPEFMILFIAGWARYSLENNYSRDPQKGYFEGFKTIINVYKKGISINKDIDVEHIAELYEKDELENWIKENVK